MSLTIAIDGPVGAGKSSVADAVAARLGILHLDTGAMYRACGLTAIRQGIDLQDEAAVTALCQGISMTVKYENGGQRTLVAGVDLTDSIRTPEVSMAASTVGRYSGVRAAMVALQQRLASQQDMLLDGRDIGTVVLPNATVKIYLTASAEERARRRFAEMQQKGAQDSYEQVLADLRQRDQQDMNRAVSPLRQADDAVLVDTSDINFEQSVEKILEIVRGKMQ